MKAPHAILCFMAVVAMFTQCKPEEDKNSGTKNSAQKTIERRKPANAAYTYTLDSGKTWLAQHGKTLSVKEENIIEAVNRTDKANLPRIGKMIVPTDLSGDIEFYMPFPLVVSSLKDVKKVLLFSYASQTFAAYENGQLVFCGPTNMGRKKDPTPEGLYYTNWKAEQTTSTFNDEWDLKWNFNIENKEGIGFHQYALPGYPASHSCLRLREDDAKYLYKWADQWELKGTDNILAKGTPVIVFGNYDFDGEKPWLQLATNPKALDMTEGNVNAIVEKYLPEILLQQKKRDDYFISKSS